MWRGLFQSTWRLLLAISLAVGPWPPAAWAAIAAEPAAAAADAADASVAAHAATAATAATDCHGDMADEAPLPAQGEAPCEDGCCADPACDPAQCRVLQAAIAPVPSPARGVLPKPDAVPDATAYAPCDPSLPGVLRPPIA